MSRFEGQSPFQANFLTWASGSGVYKTSYSAVRRLVSKPTFSFEYDVLYCEPTLAHRVHNGEEIALTEDQCSEVIAFIGTAPAYITFGVDANGEWMQGSSADLTVVDPPPLITDNQVWRWDFDTSAWIDSRSSEELDAYMANKLTALKLDAKRRVANFADALAEQIIGIAPLAEKLSWTVKAEAAVAYLANTASPQQVSMLQSECMVTGETLTELSNAILANVDPNQTSDYYVVAGLVAGQRRKTMAAIDAVSYANTAANTINNILTTAQSEVEAILASILNPQP